MDDLITRLATGDHPITAKIRGGVAASNLRDCIDRGYVHIRFTGTRGGTELGLRLDKEARELATGSFNKGSGVKIVGSVTLNAESVRCIAEIDLHTLDGMGHLEIMEREKETLGIVDVLPEQSGDGRN